VIDRDLERKFRPFGRITDYKIVTDPIERKSRGFGFVTYDSRSAAEDAVREMHGQELEGKDLIVQIAKRSKPRRPTPGKYLGNDRSRPRRRSRSRSRDRYRRRRRRSYSSSYSR
jgi:RNA recognition motif-containing protein